MVWLESRRSNVELLLATTLGFGGLGAELGCHVVVRTRHMMLLIPWSKILIAVGIGFTDDEVALDAVPARVTVETPR